ncbi:hypothetical protein ANN_10025 [Periplaneta americana]|uniref:HTH psq-type domain-containing protein n=1 Tax=Periplaneta americana TaxID=6978 RepID=A0ABQ8TN12_PERAM|nr:hypothetical protein ANN_10025 [Periplaneta americana]
MGKYKAKKVGRWTERNMDEALVAVRGCVSLKEAARQFKIPYTTLQNRHMQCMDPAKSRKQKRAGGHTVFNDEQEIELKNRIIKLAQFGHGLTKRTLGRQLTHLQKGKRSPSKDVQIGFPNDIKVITTESGWKTEDAFLLWLQHFERFRAPVSSVLVLDGHISHKSLRALEFCEEKQIHRRELSQRKSKKKQRILLEKEEQPERNHKLKSLICRKLVVSSDDDDDSIEMKTTSHVKDESVCQFCFLAYDDPRSVKKGDWIRCQGAQKEWYHEICVGAQGRKQFVCGKCM